MVLRIITIMENIKLNGFKEVMRKGMIDNFKRDGELVPMMFFFKDGMPIIGEIPNELMSSAQGKHFLANLMRDVCQEPNVFAAGVIIEANAAKLDANDETIKLIMNGSVEVFELKNKIDVILMVFSTPEEEEMFIYEVDCEKKEVNGLLTGESLKQFEGTFSNFFKWNKN